MLFQSIHPASVLGLEIKTRQVLKALSRAASGEPLDENDRRHLNQGYSIIDQVLTALHHEDPWGAAQAGVGNVTRDRDASLVFALEVAKFSKDRLRQTLPVYKRQLTDLRHGEPAPTGVPDLVDVTAFFSDYNRLVESYAGI